MTHAKCVRVESSASIIISKIKVIRLLHLINHLNLLVCEIIILQVKIFSCYGAINADTIINDFIFL